MGSPFKSWNVSTGSSSSTVPNGSKEVVSFLAGALNLVQLSKENDAITQTNPLKQAKAFLVKQSSQEEVDEMSTSGGAGAYLTPYAFRLPRKKRKKKKLNEEMAKNVELSKSNSTFSKEKIFSEASEGLADTETEKLKELAENIEFKDEQDFSKKLDVIKESYFPKTKSEPSSKEDVDSVVGDATLKSGSNEAMAAYTAAISNTLTKVKV